MSERNTCCFTGHRTKGLPFGYNEDDEMCVRLKNILKKEIETLIVRHNVNHFITGMALGTDLICAEIIIRLRNKYPDITLESAVPCITQTAKWSKAQIKRYFRIAEKCDKKTIIQYDYDNYCMLKRNKYMVDSSQIVLAVFNGSPSGTANTIHYAKQTGKRVIIVNPETLSITGAFR